MVKRATTYEGDRVKIYHPTKGYKTRSLNAVSTVVPEKQRRLTLMELLNEKGIIGSRKDPYKIVRIEEQEAGHILKKGSKKTREKVLKEPRQIMILQRLSTGKNYKEKSDDNG